MIWKIVDVATLLIGGLWAAIIAHKVIIKTGATELFAVYLQMANLYPLSWVLSQALILVGTLSLLERISPKRKGP